MADAASMSRREIREPRHLVRRQQLGLGALVAANAIADVVRGSMSTFVFLPVIVLYVVNQIRERVVVTDVDVLLVRTLWSRRISRSRIRAIRVSAHHSARLLVDESDFGIQLPFGDLRPVNELADTLGVPIQHVD